jgi:hypothetical protein
MKRFTRRTATVLSGMTLFTIAVAANAFGAGHMFSVTDRGSSISASGNAVCVFGLSAPTGSLVDPAQGVYASFVSKAYAANNVLMGYPGADGSFASFFKVNDREVQTVLPSGTYKVPVTYNGAVVDTLTIKVVCP